LKTFLSIKEFWMGIIQQKLGGCWFARLNRFRSQELLRFISVTERLNTCPETESRGFYLPPFSPLLTVATLCALVRQANLTQATIAVPANRQSSITSRAEKESVSGFIIFL
jgi:hypothetical protein